MNKGDLVNEVSKVLGTKREAQAAVDGVLSAITGALKKGDIPIYRDHQPSMRSKIKMPAVFAMLIGGCTHSGHGK